MSPGIYGPWQAFLATMTVFTVSFYVSLFSREDKALGLRYKRSRVGRY